MRLIASLLLLLMAPYLYAATPSRQPEEQIDLLIISSYSSYYSWSSRITSHIANISSGKLGKRTTTLNLPLVEVKSMKDLDTLTQKLHQSLEANTPKSIVLLGSSSFVFCEDLDKWYPGIPMVLIGGQSMTGTKEQLVKKEPVTSDNCITTSDLKKKFNITDQSTPIFLEEEVDLITKLIPEVNTLYYIGGEDQFSVSKEESLKQILMKYGGTIELKILQNGTMSAEELIPFIKLLDPKHDVVIYSSWTSSQLKSSPLVMSQMVNLLSTGEMPMFLLRDNGWIEDNPHALGGCVLNEDVYFKHLDNVMEQLLEGKPARDIPDFQVDKPIYKFNYPVFKQFGFKESYIPGDVVFIGKPIGFLEQHAPIIAIGLIAILICIITLISLLLIKSRKLLHVSEYYQRLISGLPIGYVKCKLVRDKDSFITDMKVLDGNTAFKRVCVKYLGKHLPEEFMSVMPQAGPEFIHYLNGVVRNKQRYTRFSYNATDLGRHYEVVVLFNEDDTVDIFAINISNLKKAEEDLVKAKEKAEESDKIKTSFVQNMSHEIRTPLNAIVGFSQLLSLPDGMNTEEEKQQFGDYIMNNSKMLMMLIDDILDLGDVENGNYRLEITDASCNEICQQAIKSVDYRTPDGVRMYLTSEVDDGFMVSTDPRRVQQVLINYLTNACKHTTSGEIHVHCSLSEIPGKVTFSVTDTGTGVPEDKAENIFERFSKLNAFKQGAGLGLNICQTIANKLGGEVKLDTTYKNGARFLFIIENK